jgi:hypothetical protein
LFLGYGLGGPNRQGTIRPVKRDQRVVVVGVEADKFELEAWGRAAALRRQELPEWIKRSLNETAVRGEERRSARLAS